MTTIWISKVNRDWLREEQARRSKKSVNDTVSAIREKVQSDLAMKVMNIPTLAQMREIFREEIERASNR